MKKKYQIGLTLIELMFGLAISLLMTLVISSVYVNSKKTFIVQDSVSRLQENARSGIDQLEDNIRMAGFLGCRGQSLKLINTLKTDTGMLFNYPLGVSNLSIKNNITPVTNSDIVTIWTADSEDYPLIEPMTSVTDSPIISKNNSFSIGDIVLITDCNAHTLFKISQLSPVATGVGLGHSLTVNTTDTFHYKYTPDASIYSVKAQTFYIAPGYANNGTNSLWRYCMPSCYGNSNLNPVNNEEVIKGVEKMRILYGIDQDNNNSIDEYKLSNKVLADEWSKVISLKIHLLLVSNKDSITVNQELPFDFAGEKITANDRKLRIPFKTVVTLRNRAF